MSEGLRVINWKYFGYTLTNHICCFEKSEVHLLLEQRNVSTFLQPAEMLAFFISLKVHSVVQMAKKSF